jgi:hypothetical protein
LFFYFSFPAQPSPLKVTAGLSNTLVISKAHLAQMGLFSSAVIDRITVIVSPHEHRYSYEGLKIVFPFLLAFLVLLLRQLAVLRTLVGPG